MVCWLLSSRRLWCSPERTKQEVTVVSQVGTVWVQIPCWSNGCWSINRWCAGIFRNKTLNMSFYSLKFLSRKPPVRENYFCLRTRGLYSHTTWRWGLVRVCLICCFVSRLVNIAYVLPCSFTSGLIGCPLSSKPIFEDGTAYTEFGILIPSPSGIHALIYDVGLLFVRQVSWRHYG